MVCCLQISHMSGSSVSSSRSGLSCFLYHPITKKENKFLNCLLQLPLLWRNTKIKSKLGRKGFLWHTLPYPRSSLKEVRKDLKTGTWRQELLKQLWRVGYCLLVTSAFFFIEPRNTSSGMTTPVRVWDLFHQSLNKKIPHRPADSLIWLADFLNWDSFLYDDLACVKQTSK